jgi:hypothetical protein
MHDGKIRIMFVCYGNICRSPMAEFIFKKLALDYGFSARCEISSAATSGEEIIGGVGNPVYPPARAELIRRGVCCGDRQAVRLKKEDYEKFDLFVGMEESNILSMRAIFGKDPENKIKKLLDYAGGGDVADPWYTRRFDTAFSDIFKGAAALAEALFGVKAALA